MLGKREELWTADRVQGGQREESIAQRVPRISPVGKREELRTRTACRERPAGRDRWATGEFRVLTTFFVGLARLDR